MDLRPVAPGARTLSGPDFFVLWAGVAISLAEIWAGGFLAPMGLAAALVAIVLGHVLGNTLMALGGVVGSDHGIASMVAVRPAFGVRGSALASVLNVVQLVCWASIMLIIGGRAGAQLGSSLGGVLGSERFWILFIGAGTLGWALLVGNRLWKLLQTVTVLGLAAVLIVVTVKTIESYGTATPASPAGEGLSFMAGLDLVIAMPISWMPLVADYSRFARSGASSFWSTWWGYFLVSSWMFALGLVATLVTGTAEPHLQMLELLGASGLAVPGLLMIVFSTITSDFPDLYSATCSFLNVTEKVSARAFLWLTGVVSVVVALLFPMDRYESFLYFIGAMFVPLFGVVLADYFLLRGRQLDVAALSDLDGPYGYRGGYNLVALGSWALGFAAYKLLESLQSPAGSSIPSFLLAGLVYYALSRRPMRRQGSM